MADQLNKDQLAGDDVVHLSFDDNRLVAELGGEHDAHFMILEEALGVRIDPRGNRLSVSGSEAAREQVTAALKALYARLERGESVTTGDVRAAGKIVEAGGKQATQETFSTSVKTPKRLINPRTANQASYLKALHANDLTFGVGPAGTGKTYLAVAQAVSLMISGQVDRIILSRPAVEAGEQIGFLPGDMKEKVDPYMRPLYDALYLSLIHI